MVSTRSARAAQASACGIKAIPGAVLFDALRLLEIKDLGSAIVAFGSHISKAPLAILVDEALGSNMDRSAEIVERGDYQYAVLNDHRSMGALHCLARAAFPFEARRRYFASRREMLERVSGRNELARCHRLSAALYVHDMCVLETGMRSEQCMLMSMPDAQDSSNPKRVLFLVSLGITNDCQWGCFCAGHHCIAVDVLLPESQKFESVWEYKWCSSGDSDPYMRHMSSECDFDEAARRRLNRACGLEETEGGDLYWLVDFLADLGGNDGRHKNAFHQFLEERAKFVKWLEHECERDPEGLYDHNPEEDEMLDFMGEIRCETDSNDPAYFAYPATPKDGCNATLEMGSYGVGKSFYDPPEIRTLSKKFLETIDRSSLGAVVAATQGFGARFTDDYFEQEEERMRREIEEEEAKQAAEALAASKEAPAEAPAPAPGFASRVAGRVRTWLGGGDV